MESRCVVVHIKIQKYSLRVNILQLEEQYVIFYTTLHIWIDYRYVYITVHTIFNLCVAYNSWADKTNNSFIVYTYQFLDFEDLIPIDYLFQIYLMGRKTTLGLFKCIHVLVIYFLSNSPIVRSLLQTWTLTLNNSWKWVPSIFLIHSVFEPNFKAMHAITY